MNFSHIFHSPASRVARFSCLACLGMLATVSGADIAAPVTVRDSQVAASSKTGIRIVRGTVELPRKGDWAIESPFAELGGLTEVYANPSEEERDNYEGERMAKLQDLRATRDRRRELSHVYWECSSLAREGDGVGPKDLAELENRGPRPLIAPNGERKPAEGIHLVPGVRMFKVDNEKKVRVDSTELLLIDTTPAIGDGKHWTFDCRGVAKREAIDAEKMKELGLTIVARRPPHEDGDANRKETVDYRIYARLSGQPALVTLTARDHRTKKTLEVRWDTREAAGGDDAICAEWAELRLAGLDAYVRSDAPVALTWAQRIAGQYGIGETYRDWRPDVFGEDRRGRTTTAMGVLGGRAAIRETLQMRNLQAAAEDAASWNPTIPIADIPGVEVEAHPFDKMLGENPGGRLALADWIPHDRFMVYFPKPDGIFSLLEGGAGFMFASGSMMTGRSMSYHLKERYLESFGISEDLMKRFLKTGAIEEMAVSIPDLFLIDGAEMSVVMRTGKPLLTTAALALVGVPPGSGTTVKKNARGEEVYWARQGSILIVSTNHDELQAILKAKESGKGLGTSAELRFMLTKVPVTPQTSVYAYFSDPFIRRLVGPEVKIGQLRRLMARRELEEASAGALLARFDGQGERSFDLAFLQEHGYMDAPFYAGDLALDQSGWSSSGYYGSAARLNSLTDLPVEKASEHEKKAYEQYLEGYNRFWRRYYDPIAIRYEQHGEGRHQLETFILPLIDNSIYGGLRQFLTPEGREMPIRVPVIEPTPVATLSVSLNEDAWLETMDDFADEVEELLGLDGTLLDLLGPDVHLAIQDADPIIALGSGELEGLFGQVGSDSDMMAIPVLVSMLTRPCTLHIGLEDPALVRKKLAEMAWAPDFGGDLMTGGFGEGALYQVTGQQKWIYRYSLEGIITLRFGIEVQDRYLVINNLPFSNAVKVTGNKQAPGGAAYLEVNPAACVVQHPVLFASAMEKLRLNALAGVACLSPMILSGAEDVRAAQAAHAKLFGFEPVHPAGGTWTWDSKSGDLVSSLFGPMWSQQQPAFDPDNKAAAILGKVSRLGLGMQFEEDGLRSTVEWKVR